MYYYANLDIDGNLLSYLESETFIQPFHRVSREEYDRIMAENGLPLSSEPEPPESAEEDAAAMLVDHEYRLTLLELGVM